MGEEEGRECVCVLVGGASFWANKPNNYSPRSKRESLLYRRNDPLTLLQGTLQGMQLTVL